MADLVFIPPPVTIPHTPHVHDISVNEKVVFTNYNNQREPDTASVHRYFFALYGMQEVDVYSISVTFPAHNTSGRMAEVRDWVKNNCWRDVLVWWQDEWAVKLIFLDGWHMAERFKSAFVQKPNYVRALKDGPADVVREIIRWAEEHSFIVHSPRYGLVLLTTQDDKMASLLVLKWSDFLA